MRGTETETETDRETYTYYYTYAHLSVLWAQPFHRVGPAEATHTCGEVFSIAPACCVLISSLRVQLVQLYLWWWVGGLV